MIIGLTGKNAAGKGEVAEYLKKRGFEYHSLSDEIREEVRQRGREITRGLLIETGNELRTKYGPGVLAERVLERLEQDRNYVIDSIRNPGEVAALRRRKDFVLLAVEADAASRFERSRIRSREGAAQTLEEFAIEEARELESGDAARRSCAWTVRLYSSRSRRMAGSRL